MKIGILYNVVDRMERGFEEDILSDNEIVGTVQHVQAALRKEHLVVPVRVRPELFSILRATSFDIIFNLCEGIDGNVMGETWVPAFLDIFGIPYTGSNSFTLALCLDKGKTKDILMANSIPTPPYQVFTNISERISTDLNFPLIVKPVHEDASVGITLDSVVHDEAQLMQRIEHVLDNYCQPALVEEYIEGREINVAIIGNGGHISILPFSEILFDYDDDTARVVDYEAKWIDDSRTYGRTRGVCPASLPPGVEKRIREYAVKAYELTGCQDYARVDFRLREDIPYVLEVNPNPGINVDSGFVRSAKASGLDYEGLIRNILNAAVKRTDLKSINGRKPCNNEKAMSGNIIVKPVGMEHICEILKWFNDPEVSKHMDNPDNVYTEEGLIESFFIRTTGDENLVIYDKKRREEIGFASIYEINESNKSGEIAFLIGEKDFRGRGHGKAIIRFLCRIGFEKLALNSLLAVCTIRNKPAIKVFEQTGFKKIGIRRQHHDFHGEKIDEVLFEILRSDYEESQELEG